MIETTDFFEHSMFIGRAISRTVNARLAAVSRDVSEYLSTQHVQANLYLSGSLARREPSIEIRPNGARLCSDIDFVLATTADERDRCEVQDLQRWAIQRWPDLDVSVVFVPVARLAEMRSCFAHDFAIAFPHPIYVAIEDVAGPGTRTLTAEDVFETAIHQFATFVLLDPAIPLSGDGIIYARRRNYRGAAAVLECLRGLAAEHGEIARYSEIFRWCQVPPIAAIASVQEVAAAIRAREVYEGTFPDKLLLPLMLRLASRYLSGAAQSLDVEQLLSVIASRSEDVVDPVWAFRYAILAFACGQGRTDLEPAVAGLIRRIIHSLPSSEAPWVQRIAELPYHTTDCIPILRRFREDYLRKLHKRNLGWCMPASPNDGCRKKMSHSPVQANLRQ